MAMLEGSDLGLSPIRPAGLAGPEQVMLCTQRNMSFFRKKLQPQPHRFFDEQASGSAEAADQANGVNAVQSAG